MANLITSHDPFHVHKLLGTMSCLHFLYRLYLLVTCGDAFPPLEPRWISNGGILLHGCLSWSSLFFKLPINRNYTSPMIWPEFRLHSILFASRHVVCTILTRNELWPIDPLHLTLWNAVIVIGTISIASNITDRFGDREKRTTNALPYPSWVTEEQRRRIQMSYAKAQFAATHVCILPDTTITFFCLLGIQSAPFLMTLVRKGKIDSHTYHQFYAFALWLGFVISIIRFTVRNDFAFFGFASMSSMMVRHLRLYHKMDAKLLWLTHLLLIRIVYPYVVTKYDLAFYYPMCQKAVPWLFISMVRQLYVYEPLMKRNFNPCSLWRERTVFKSF